MIIIKTYSELNQIPTYKERFEYLMIHDNIGKETFGGHRSLNQDFYRSQRWRDVRRKIILRDNGCDMGLDDYPIYGELIIHHINPITIDDILLCRDIIFDPENLITVAFKTHNALHFGSYETILKGVPIERVKNDTCPWR